MQESQATQNNSTTPTKGEKEQAQLKRKLKPLKVTCTSSDCGNDLHCFLTTQKMVRENTKGHCRSCGVSLINWDRVHSRKFNDVLYTFSAMKKELIRHHFWHVEIDVKAVNHARRKGKQGMREAVSNRLLKSVGDAYPPFDGRQTRKSGNVIFYAQHATATCCRKCIQEWHGIEMGRELTEAELAYFAKLVMLYIEERLPHLTENGEKIPPITSRRQLKDLDELLPEVRGDNGDEW